MIRSRSKEGLSAFGDIVMPADAQEPIHNQITNNGANPLSIPLRRRRSA